jgi:predicted DNA-binding protein
MDKRITIRIPNELYEKLKQQSDETGYTLSEIIRMKLQKGNRGEIPNKKLTKEFVYELNRIGNNINQIAKHCNTKKAIDRLAVLELAKIKELLEKLTNDC